MAKTSWTAVQMSSQAGRTALVTGANSGIGYQASVELARRGAHVLMGCRDPQRGQDALEQLGRDSDGGSAELVAIDMASLESVHRAADALAASGRPLDLLVNNAGVMALPAREVTADGFERQFGTNHLGHFALTGLLMPLLLAAPAPRVVTVSSLAHRNGKIAFDNLQGERKYVPWDAYNASKLANLLFARELARRSAEAGGRLLSVACHPGISRTQIFSNGPGASDMKWKIVRLMAPIMLQNDVQGAWPTLYAATADGISGGDYIGPDGLMAFKGHPTLETPKPQAMDEAVGRRLWTVSEELTGVRYPPLA